MPQSKWTNQSLVDLCKEYQQSRGGDKLSLGSQICFGYVSGALQMFYTERAVSGRRCEKQGIRPDRLIDEYIRSVTRFGLLNSDPALTLNKQLQQCHCEPEKAWTTAVCGE